MQFTTASDRHGRTPPRSGARGHLSTSRLRAHWVPLQLRSATACFPGGSPLFSALHAARAVGTGGRADETSAHSRRGWIRFAHP